ncbi:glycosyltransferase family 1 [Opitutaceae bacterium TAV5]|nr:glycosyltransferase family 1 [Opitutaceae bacterium TAV5]
MKLLEFTAVGLLGILSLQALSLQAGPLLLQNLTTDETAGYGLFDSDGGLLSGATTGNLRLGYFSLDDAGIAAAWAAGDLGLLSNSFVQYGARGDMQNWGGAYDGLFQTSISATSNPFAGQNVYLFVSTGSDFTDTGAEYLIYKFDVVFQPESFVAQALLGTTPGQLLVGGYNHFSHDYQLGGGALPGFNMVAVVPESGAWALLFSGVSVLACLRRRVATRVVGAET